MKFNNSPGGWLFPTGNNASEEYPPTEINVKLTNRNSSIVKLTWNLETLQRWLVGRNRRVSRIRLVRVIIFRHILHRRSFDDCVVCRVSFIISDWLENRWSRRVFLWCVRVCQHQLESSDCVVVVMIVVLKRLLPYQSSRRRWILRHRIQRFRQFTPGSLKKLCNHVGFDFWSCSMIYGKRFTFPRRLVSLFNANLHVSRWKST